jgi:DNA-directed RNA polymerase specialized sigma24 family protein
LQTGNQGATAKSAAAPHYYQRGGISMTEDEAYKVHIQYTFNAFCKIVIRHAAIDKILNLRRRWEREVSLDYLMNEKFVQLAEPEQLEEYLFTACDQTAVLYHAELAAALARLLEQTQEEIFRYYFLRQPQRVIGVHIGRTRSTAGRHIQLVLKRLRRLMEGKDYE